MSDLSTYVVFFSLGIVYGLQIHVIIEVLNLEEDEDENDDEDEDVGEDVEGDEDEDEDEDEPEDDNSPAARIARLLQGRLPFRNMIFRLSNGSGGFVELGGLPQRRQRPPARDANIDLAPSRLGQELMRSGDFGAVGYTQSLLGTKAYAS